MKEWEGGKNTYVVSHLKDGLPYDTNQLAGEGGLRRALGPLTAHQSCGGQFLREVFRAISPNKSWPTH